MGTVCFMPRACVPFPLGRLTLGDKGDWTPSIYSNCQFLALQTVKHTSAKLLVIPSCFNHLLKSWLFQPLPG